MIHLLSYDVQDDKVRTKIMKYLKDRGYHLQKSVFMLECKDAKTAQDIYKYVMDLTDPSSDRVFMVPLCNACLERKKMSGAALDFDKPYWIV